MTEQTPTPEAEQPVEETPATPEETPEQVEATPDPDDVDLSEFNAKDRRAIRRANEEAKKYRLELRERQYQLDELRAQLFEARTAAADVLIDPADLPFDPDIVDDPAAIEQAARDLVAERPYLGKHRTTTNIGQHETGGAPSSFSLADAIRDAVTGR